MELRIFFEIPHWLFVLIIVKMYLDKKNIVIYLVGSHNQISYLQLKYFVALFEKQTWYIPRYVLVGVFFI